MASVGATARLRKLLVHFIPEYRIVFVRACVWKWLLRGRQSFRDCPMPVILAGRSNVRSADRSAGLGRQASGCRRGYGASQVRPPIEGGLKARNAGRHESAQGFSVHLTRRCRGEHRQGKAECYGGEQLETSHSDLSCGFEGTIHQFEPAPPWDRLFVHPVSQDTGATGQIRPNDWTANPRLST